MLPSVLDPIVAAITPAGVGGVSVLRISGAQALECVAPLVPKLDLAAAAPNSVHFVQVQRADGTTVDDALVTVFRAPHSYTGEDVVEISCHGNPMIVATVQQLLVAQGARTAEPGEFTRRAFLNGKLDLTQAEAVADLVSATSDAAIRSSHRQLHGALGNRIRTMIDELVHVSGLLELELDFVEEGIQFADKVSVQSALGLCVDQLDELIASFRHGKLFAHGISIAIAGKPNAGKSSLLNRILGEERAIVSPTPGTTRDTIDIAIQHNGFRLQFWDTAGLRPSAEGIEQMGIDRTKARIQQSDVVLLVCDGSIEPDEPFIDAARADAPSQHVLLAVNKSDLPQHPRAIKLLESNRTSKHISAISGDGVQELLDAITEIAYSEGNIAGDQIAITNSRHLERLQSARVALGTATSDVPIVSPEFVSVSIRSAIESLGEITGAVTSDEILRRVFENFCIGK